MSRWSFQCASRGRRGTRAATGIAAATVLLLGAGCWSPAAPREPELRAGLLWVFPGVEGGAWSMEQPCRALRDAGVSSAIHVHDWSKLFGTVVNLVSIEQNRADAQRIAREIVAYRANHPTAPVDLLGYSGGAGMAIFVAEALPESVRVRNVVLAQPALSPTYDLRPALRRVDGKLVNFYCPSDVLLLGAGTSALGTMDRQFVASAGQCGFREDAVGDDSRLREHFEQRAWSVDTMTTGHLGDHFGILGYAWNRRYVAPYFLPGEVGESRSR